MISKDSPSVSVDPHEFKRMLGAVGISSSRSTIARSFADTPEIFPISRNAWIPNNNSLPTLIYRSALDVAEPDPASAFEQRFLQNGWPPQWRGGIYDFHHYHSTAHEVLGIAAGSARVMLGGPSGYDVTLTAGDVLVLPAGTGHCCLHSSSDFLVVGAYPPRQSWDICRSAPSCAERERIRRLPFPASDPLTGANGPLVRLWRSASETAA